jgi:hypothetical protein
MGLFHWRKPAGVVLSALALLLSGCSQPSSNSNVPPPVPSLYAGPGLVGTGSTNPLAGAAGATVPITLNGSDYNTKLQTLTSWVATHPLNSPQDFELNVRLSPIGPGGNMFQGQIGLAYYDTSQYYIATLSTGMGSNGNTSFPAAYNQPDAYYNQWFWVNGKRVFHGFVQDSVGAVVLVIDSLSTVGDGSTLSGTASGSLWFKNFAVTQSQDLPDDQCWFFPSGPYSCATFFVGGQPVTNSAIYPSPYDGYQLLGTFTGLNVQQAFGL